MPTMTADAIQRLPGFRRRFRITPAAGSVLSEVEDDYHCMRLRLHHDGVTALRVEARLLRAPWTTCPGAAQQVQQTFTGVALDAFVSRGDKSGNCTHLHDLALLAAAHAGDGAPTTYDILVSDPVDGRRHAQLRCNGEVLLTWIEEAGRLLQPQELQGRSLNELRDWIDGLDARMQEAARLLRWGAILAHGRQIPLERQSDPRRMPPNCYTFQPQRLAQVQRIVAIRDFSRGGAQPLESIEIADAAELL